MKEIDAMKAVDVDPRVHRATVDDEEEVLSDLYGAPEQDGVYRGEEI